MIQIEKFASDSGFCFRLRILLQIAFWFRSNISKILHYKFDSDRDSSSDRTKKSFHQLHTARKNQFKQKNSTIGPTLLKQGSPNHCLGLLLPFPKTVLIYFVIICVLLSSGAQAIYMLCLPYTSLECQSLDSQTSLANPLRQ